MADNPFSVRVPNLNEAIAGGEESYNAVQKLMQGNQLKQAREAAAQNVMQGGDLKNSLAMLMGIGDKDGANTLATVMHNQQTGDFQNRQLGQQASQFQISSGETARHDKASEGLTAAAQAEARRQHDLDLGKPFKAGEDYFGQPTYLARDKSGNYVPVKLPDQPGAAPGAVQPAPQQSVVPPQSPAPSSPPAPPASAAPPQPVVTAQPQPQPQPQPAISLNPEEQRKAAFLESRPPAIRGIIKGIANYDQDERMVLSRMPPGAKARVISDLAEYDPTYSQANYPSIVDARKKFGAGALGVAIRSFDVSIGHLEQLKGYAEALNNGDVRIINQIRNKWREETGSDLPTNFEALKPVVSGEVTKAIIGSQNAFGDREEFRKPLISASSPAQFAGAIGTYQKAMAEQLAGTEKQYADTTKWKNFRERLRPETLKVLESHSRPASSGAAPPRINSAAERDALPPGTVYIAPDGSQRTKQ